MTPSPYDHTVAFIKRSDPRSRAAVIGLILAAAWSIWVVYYLLEHRDSTGTTIISGGTVVHSVDWFNLARDAVGEIGSGVLLMAGIVWLVGLVPDDPAA